MRECRKLWRTSESSTLVAQLPETFHATDLVRPSRGSKSGIVDRIERPWCRRFAPRMLFALAVMAVLTTAILLRPAKWLSDFDQSFYLTIAYDLKHHGVFSNGKFDDVNSVVAVPPPGMFFAPLYPWLIVAATAVDPRFSAAVDCSVQENQKMRTGGNAKSTRGPC